ncbi:radical SAM protein [Actinoplanes sp. NPDC048988]|uniref:radical SAM protein n=1 Tax=Actinoplanes sp. NPDC048988 TaxID=3363901 RepID=UPI00371B4B37
MRARIDVSEVVCWRLTLHCNRACVFCLSRSGPRFSHPSFDPMEVPARLADLGVKKISFSGGEPTTFEGLPELVERGDELGLAQALTTNGDSLEGSIPAWFGRLEHVKLSFYGDSVRHDSFMGQGHYSKQLSLARRLAAEADLSCTANFMLSRLTSAGLKRFLDDATAAGFFSVVIQTYIENRRARIDDMHRLGQTSGVLKAVESSATEYSAFFSGGVRVHDFSQNDWLVVLDDRRRLVLPSNEQTPDHVMGDLFDTVVTTLAGDEKATPAALEEVWEKQRYGTAIRVFPHAATAS